MLYINDLNKKFNSTKILDLKLILTKMKSLSDPNVTYYLCVKNSSFCIVGVKSCRDSNCIIDLYNSNIETVEFYYWLRDVLSNYDDYYCVPNLYGSIIWKGFGLKSKDIYINFSPLKLFRKKIKIRFLKFLFFNMFFTLTTDKGLFKIKKKLFYKKNIPEEISLDTF